MLFRRKQLVHYISLSTHLHRKIHQTIFSWMSISTLTLFYLTTLIHSFHRPLRVTAGSAALADIPIRNESWSMRLLWIYCKLYHSLFLWYLKKVTKSSPSALRRASHLTKRFFTAIEVSNSSEPKWSAQWKLSDKTIFIYYFMYRFIVPVPVAARSKA